MGKIQKEKFVRKNITITEKQEKFIDENDMKLSKFTQRKINEEIKRRKI